MPRPYIPKREFRRLFIGEWLRRLGRKQNDAAKAIGMTEQYMSELISGKKKNPNPALLLDLSEWLGLTINDFYRPPPPADLVQAVEDGMTPAQMAALGTLLDKVKRAKK